MTSRDNIAPISINTESTETDDAYPHNDDVTNTPVDGGWGWVIVVAGFFNSLLMGFLISSFSVFYVALVEHFDSDRGETGWIGSLFSFTGYFLGKLYGIMQLCARMVVGIFEIFILYYICFNWNLKNTR